MKTIQVIHIDAFCSEPYKGNPAGIVLNSNGLSEQEMLAIAKTIGFNETTFIFPSTVADYQFRYFTPGHEMNLCGHATVGSIFALYRNGHLHQEEITIETKVGVLPVKINKQEASIQITMQQAKPEFKPFTGSIEALASAIGIDKEEIDDSYPIVYGSTGTWTLLIPIKSMSSFQKMTPQTNHFPDVLIDMPRSSVHPFCLEVRDKGNDMHARHFSSPFSGTVEDAVTGTASGVMGAYYKQYINPDLSLPHTFVVEQGHEMDKDGLVHVHVDQEGKEITISISGTAVFVKNMEVII